MLHTQKEIVLKHSGAEKVQLSSLKQPCFSSEQTYTHKHTHTHTYIHTHTHAHTHTYTDDIR